MLGAKSKLCRLETERSIKQVASDCILKIIVDNPCKSIFSADLVAP